MYIEYIRCMPRKYEVLALGLTPGIDTTQKSKKFDNT